VRRGEDLSGRRFGKWLVVRFEHTDANRQRRWLVRCDCGFDQLMSSGELATGRSSQCRACSSKARKVAPLFEQSNSAPTSATEQG
jgi:hypothetical protein